MVSPDPLKTGEKIDVIVSTSYEEGWRLRGMTTQDIFETADGFKQVVHLVFVKQRV